MTTQTATAPAESLPESVVSQVRALEPVVESLLSRIKAALAEKEPVQVIKPADGSDDTDERLYAYLASIRPIRGVIYLDDLVEVHQRGRALIERMAQNSEDTEPSKLRLTASECADVLRMISDYEPIKPETWWTEEPGTTSHVIGFMDVMECLAASLREPPVTDAHAANGIDWDAAGAPGEHCSPACREPGRNRGRTGANQGREGRRTGTVSRYRTWPKRSGRRLTAPRCGNPSHRRESRRGYRHGRGR